MKFHGYDFSEYIDSFNIYNLHPKNNNLYHAFFNKPYHLIIHGPSGIGKYTQSLKFIYPFSKSSLKYQKKITISNEKSKCIFKLSDIHIEIDFHSLGCNSKTIWNDIFLNILNIIYTNKYDTFFIICKNFQTIHNELHESMYSYMQTFMHKHVNIYFIINTTNISGINKNIISASYIVTLTYPSHSAYKKMYSQKNINIPDNSINSLKYDIYIDKTNVYTHLFNTIISNDIDINHFRKILYDILIYNLNIDECIWFIITNFYNHHKINYIDITLAEDIFTFYSQYNNNYRPIYHLELFFLNFIIKNRELTLETTLHANTSLN